MRANILLLALLCALIVGGGAAWGMSEAILTATSDKVVAREDNEFKDAMGVWLKHRYTDGAKMLEAFAKKHPDSRWAAEAELHVGCYNTFQERYGEARPIFERLIAKHKDNNIATKAKIRLGNVAEREGKFDEAIDHYCRAMKMNPRSDQFKYANFRARKLIMTRGKRLAMINCGPTALAACLDAMGKPEEAALARRMAPGTDGVSLAALAFQAETLGAKARCVEIPVQQLKTAALPILAHVQPNHYIAILAVNGDKAEVEDSISGRREVTLASLEARWSGKAVTFAPDTNLVPLTMMAALETVGGCCGNADDDECLGDSECECDQSFSGSPGGPTNNCPGSGCYMMRSTGGDSVPAGGSPIWEVNTINLNMLVKDTPIWYNPGTGPQIAFTLTYSNENSNTGIFGPGWRCPYDMKVFFLPGCQNYPDLQVHRDNGRIETYEYDCNTSQYNPRSGMAAYGYRKGYNPVSQTSEYIKILTADEAGQNQENVPDGAGTVMLVLPGGGKYFFKKQGSGATVEGRIYIIQDSVGKRVECGYTSGCLSSVTDANGRETTIETTGSGDDERVTQITLPTGDGRQATFSYTDGNLTSITDMNGAESTFGYDALAWGDPDWPSTTLAQYVTVSPLSPADGGDLAVGNISYFPYFPYGGAIKVNDNEIMMYTGKKETEDGVAFTGITRGAGGTTPANADIGDPVILVSTPYLSTIETPSKKTEFTYEWWTFLGVERAVVALHGVYECGPTEGYPTTPTIHYAWCSTASPYYTKVTRFPTSVTSGGGGCQEHWQSGLTKRYLVYTGTADATGGIMDELLHTVVTYGYNANRDRTSVTDANGKTTTYYYEDHDMKWRKDPLDNKWEYTYTNHRVETETDPYGKVAKAYTYNSAGQITKIETELTVGTRSTLVENHYDASGRLDWSKDGRGNQTDYHYNENNETRGFLTSVHDPAGKVTTYHYDAKGRRDQVTTPKPDTSGQTVTTTYEYDDLDRITKITNPDDTTIETKWTCCHKAWVQDENGRRTYYVYDAKNRLFKEIASAKSTTLAQDVTTSDPDDTGNDTLALDSVTSFSANGGSVVVLDEIMTYTGINTQNNTLTGIHRGVHKVNVGSGWAVGRVDTVPATYGYDTQYLNRMISLTDANDHTTYYTHYANEKLETIRYPDDKGEKYTYDDAGNLIKKEYGSFGTYPDQTFTPNNDLTVNYAYDANNRLIRTWH